MKQIKFRAWDTKYNTWVHGYPEILQNVMSKNTLLIHSFSDWGLNSTHECEIDSLGEFTGLIDENGEEIYEGDIVELINNLERKKACDAGHMEGVYEVWFNPESLRYEGKHHTPLDWSGTESIEILGNIYENPNLLNQ